MRIKDIHRFFEELDRRLDVPVEIIVTGGAAAILQGAERATLDIDFEIKLKVAKRKGSERWAGVQRAIEETAEVTGIAPEYEEDIDRWSSIALPKKESRPYRSFGKVDVRILDPGLWAIGKLSRYLASDIQDLRAVLKKTGTDARVVELWGTALGISPASSAQSAFRKQVEAFLDSYAQEIWGSKGNPIELKTKFLEAAQKAQKPKRRKD